MLVVSVINRCSLSVFWPGRHPTFVSLCESVKALQRPLQSSYNAVYSLQFTRYLILYTDIYIYEVCITVIVTYTIKSVTIKKHLLLSAVILTSVCTLDVHVNCRVCRASSYVLTLVNSVTKDIKSWNRGMVVRLRVSKPLWKVSGRSLDIFLTKNKLKQGMLCYIWLEGSSSRE